MADLEAELARFETELARFEQPDPHGFRHPINGGNGVIPDAKVKLPPPRLPPPGQGGPGMVRMSGAPPPQIMPPPPSLRPPPVQQGQPPPPPRPGPPPPHLLAPAPRILQVPLPTQPPVILGPAPPQHNQEIAQGPSGNSYQYGGEFFGYQQDINSGYSAGPSYAPPQASAVVGTQHAEDVSNPAKKPKDGETKKRKPAARQAAGEKWFDPTLAEWDESDFRIFVGDLGNEVNDDILSKAFAKYPTFQKAKVIRDKRTNKTKGYGFVSFVDGNDFAKAIKEMQGKYIGNRPCKLRKSTWKERADPDPKRKYKEKPQKGNAYKRQRGVLHK